MKKFLWMLLLSLLLVLSGRAQQSDVTSKSHFCPNTNTWVVGDCFSTSTTPSGTSYVTIKALASNASITSFSGGSGLNTTMNCNVSHCGLDAVLGLASPQINLGAGTNSLTVNCQGPATINSLTGNSAAITFSYSNCPNASGPWANAIGSNANIYILQPAEAVPCSPITNTPTAGTCGFIYVNSDGHTRVGSIFNGVIRGELNLDTNGPAGIFGNSPSGSPGSLYIDINGNTCTVGGVANQPANVCAGTWWTNTTANSRSGLLGGYIGNTLTAPATEGGQANLYPQSDGQPVIVQEFVAPGFAGTQTFSNFFTTSSGGYGQLTFYKIGGYVECTANCASNETVYVSLTFTSPSAAHTLSTCGSPGGAGNMMAVCATTPSTAWNLTTNAYLPFEFGPVLTATGATNFTLVVTTANGSGSAPTYNLGWYVEIH